MLKIFCYICVILSIFGCENKNEKSNSAALHSNFKIIEGDTTALKNKKIVEAVKKFGPTISSTYDKAVCTELVIQIIEKFNYLDKTDKNRIRIITHENIQNLLENKSSIPKGVYYALTEKGIGTSIDSLEMVIEGDFVQFWTSSWGHCGIVKSVDIENKTMELYSSFPSTYGYGIQTFDIPKEVFFVRLK